MKILGKTIYRGPHLYSQTPMICLKIDLGTLEKWPTHKIPYFKDRLLALLPGLDAHGCSYGEPGGFIKRMTEGTWLGHVTEHVALELQTQAGMPVTRGKTRSVKTRPGVYNIMFEYEPECEKAGLWAGRFALELVNSLLPRDISGLKDLEKLGCEGAEFIDVAATIEYLKERAARERLGPTTRSIVKAARRRDIPAMRIDEESLVQLGWGKNQRRIRGSITDATSNIAVDAAGDKELTKKLLSDAGVPVPEGECVREVEDALKIAHDIGYPVTIKPLDGNHGRGVTTNILDDKTARQAFALALAHSRHILVEKHYTGRDYRILMINGRLSAVSERIPAHITGDGVHSIGQLIETLNQDPRRGHGHENILSKIIVDHVVVEFLARAGLSLETIPLKRQQIFLCSTANISTGGTAIDRTQDIHPANITIMERAVKAIGLDVAGIDVVTEDISRPLRDCGGGIIEINASPGFRMHLHPSEGQPRPVGEAIVSMLFPKNTPARIPTIAITGTNGKSTTARMIAQILRCDGKRVGLTSTSGIYNNDDLLWAGDASGPQSARRILRDRTIDVAVLETARGGLLREGLGVDYCDVGVVLNVTADHLGLAGIETIEDLAAVKSVVVESVGSNGLSILNADDPLTRDMARHAGGTICFFSMAGNPMREYLRTHIQKGGMAVVKESWAGQEEIVIHKDGQRIILMETKHIPATQGGMADFNVQNALAATAIALGLEVEIDKIRTALSNFASSYEENPGRFNIHDDHGFRIIMDYAHNPAALSAFLNVTEKMRQNHGNIIGSISTPGDRRDEDIREMGRIAAGGFDSIVFREGPDQRGRPIGELTRLLQEGALNAGFPAENIRCINTEEDALDLCLQKAKPGDLVIVTPTDVSGIWQRILSFKPQFSDHHKPALAKNSVMYA